LETKKTHETKRSENWESFYSLEPELDQAEDDDGTVKATPAVLKVPVQPERDDLQARFNGKYGREHLHQVQAHKNDIFSVLFILFKT